MQDLRDMQDKSKLRRPYYRMMIAPFDEDKIINYMIIKKRFLNFLKQNQIFIPE